MEQPEFRSIVHLFKALADESRLKIIAILADRECSVEELAALLSLKAPTVSHHLGRLKELGLVQMRPEGTTHVYRFDAEALRRINKELLTREKLTSIASDIERDTWDRRVLETFFDGERLKEIPASRKKRRVILQWLVERFEPGVRYAEPALNEMIKRFHPDTATLRRELVAGKLMQRDQGVYWRLPDETLSKSMAP